MNRAPGSLAATGRNAAFPFHCGGVPTGRPACLRPELRSCYGVTFAA